MSVGIIHGYNTDILAILEYPGFNYIYHFNPLATTKAVVIIFLDTKYQRAKPFLVTYNQKQEKEKRTLM